MSSKPFCRFVLDASLRHRFESKVLVLGKDECWPFTGSLDKDGYGQIGVMLLTGKRTMVKAHQVAVAIDGRSMPVGCEVCHSCNNEPCCNPGHLYVGDRKTNALDVVACGSQRGEKNPACRISEAKVSEIRRRRRSGEKLKAIAGAMGCTESTVSRISNLKGRVQA